MQPDNRSLIVYLSNPVFLDLISVVKLEKANWTHEPPNILLLVALAELFALGVVDACVGKMYGLCLVYSTKRV